ncbi:efflux transporter outer membrane subunit [Niveibacterium sp. 24ML]|uniref:efflux transporter outer membrane subunit n=1 Tax=Niveibacterium sp. 24ML TaxID=2985512 RepID=UPI00226F17FD|nr:efflux transporter outer membrane subunit [Niveibacterium sp. 24ML]MCX9155833.1 efflux transporter outer membrane subunit [Niveibacterium sp. 24ML]
MPKTPFAILPLVLMLSACNMAPVYVRPDVEAPPQWGQAEPASARSEAAVASEWWKLFGDEVLNQLIDTALAENKDMKVAYARIEQARAQLGITDTQRYPQISGNASDQHSMRSTEAAPRLPGDRHSEDAKAMLGVSYELDLWGRLRNASDAAREKLLSSEYSQQALRISLESQVATAYFKLLALDRQLEIARINLATQEETLHMTQRRFEGGVASGYDYAQARAQTQQTRTTIPDLERQITLQQNALSILLGRNPGPITRGRSIDTLSGDFEVPAGLPSQLLERRPDILSAEAQLRAANANIGAARAAFFPKISLTGAAGYESSALHTLGDPGSAVWSLAAGLAQPIFTGGQLKNQLRQAEASEREMVANYQKTVQTAFRETEDGLVNLRKTREQIDGKRQRAAALAEAQHISFLRYQEGLTSFMDVLDAERNQLQAELDVVNLQNQQLAYTVSLFAALGGGWAQQP